ncbi:hypothetical protein [Lysobacter sp. D1-1-M9]|uniref:hypothetical protein n=1 Tax=Novilysobacter longmucuonensis TaxID=3098603 RepID=UPI002FC9D5D6
MPTSRNSSGTSATCRPENKAFAGRLEWRPSRLLIAALGALGVLAAIALAHSDLPAVLAWPLASAALGYGIWLAWQEARRPVRQLVIADDGARTTIDDIGVAEFTVAWRGPLAFARWTDADGHCQRLVWWPDTLAAAQRRELRLAIPARPPSRPPGSMAT